MEWLLTTPIFIHIVSFLTGMFLTLLGNYLKFASDIAFIKGQLTEIIRKHESIDELSEKYVKMKQDLEQALSNIKLIEHKVCKEKINGGVYGSNC